MWLRNSARYVTHSKRSAMHCQAITHDGDQFGMNLVLMLLIVALELVKLGKHHRLSCAEVPPDRFPNVRNERYDD